jgi:DNA-directed RNA polymerase specialized sigma24 family protein
MPVQLVQGVTRPDDEELFVQHACRLQAVVSATVRTWAANVDDACGLAWLQLVRHRPPALSAFAWLCTTAIREAIKLQHRTGRLMDLDGLAEVAADPTIGPEPSLALIAAGEHIRAARLRPREARVLGLRVAGYSRDEIAELTGESLRTIDRQLGRARRKVRDAL